MLFKFVSTLILSTLLPNLVLAADYTEQTQKAREEQKAYFESLHRKQQLFGGLPQDIGFAASCKYVSSIFEPAIPRVVHLTFDDGPSAVLTPKLLDILKEQNVNATFFVIGASVAKNKAILARATSEGHIIASHSWDHQDFHTLSEAQQINQITTTDKAIEAYTNNFKLFRYPYGNSTCFSNQKVHAYGYTGIVGWHIDSCDWAFAAKGYVTDKQAAICEVEPANKANFVGHVMREVQKKDGGVILMHDVHENTVDSVKEIILRLKKAGYSFMNLDDPRVNKFFK